MRRRRPTRARFARDERGTRVRGKDSFSSRLALDARVLFFLLGFYAGYSVTVINVWCFPLIVLRQKNALLYFQSLKCCINQILFQVIYRVNSVYLYSGLRSLEWTPRLQVSQSFPLEFPANRWSLESNEYCVSWEHLMSNWKVLYVKTIVKRNEISFFAFPLPFLTGDHFLNIVHSSMNEKKEKKRQLPSLFLPDILI